MASIKQRLTAYIDNNPVLKRLYRNAGIIFSGNVVSALLGLLTLMVITRALSLDDFGHYALITAFIGMIDRLTSFQTWQALIHFGTHAREDNDKPLIMSLFAFGWGLDTISGFIGFFLAILAAMFVPAWFGLNIEHTNTSAVTITAIAATVLLVNWTSTPTAILRLYDKFYAQALYQKVTASLLLLGAATLWLNGTTTILPYVIVWAVGTIAGRLLFMTLAIREIKANDTWCPSAISMRTLFAKTDGLWKYVIGTNMNGIVRVVRDFDIFVVNAILGTSAAGLYRVARKIVQLCGKVTGPFHQAVYPELTKLYAAAEMNDFLRLLRQSSLTLGGIISVIFFGFLTTGWFFLPLLFGEAYRAAYSTTVFCLAGITIWEFAHPLFPAMMALGKIRTIVITHFLATILYAVLLISFMHVWALPGAGLAFLLFYSAWSACMYIAFKKMITYTPRNHNKD